MTDLDKIIIHINLISEEGLREAIEAGEKIELQEEDEAYYKQTAKPRVYAERVTSPHNDISQSIVDVYRKKENFFVRFYKKLVVKWRWRMKGGRRGNRIVSK